VPDDGNQRGGGSSPDDGNQRGGGSSPGDAIGPPTGTSCDPANCPKDESTKSTGAGRCCGSGLCSCGGSCDCGPDCWIRTKGEGRDATVEELCSPPTDCVYCGGDPNAYECCTSCTDEGRCSIGPSAQGGGSIRRRPA
jgi:hypothetical protein